MTRSEATQRSEPSPSMPSSDGSATTSEPTPQQTSSTTDPDGAVGDDARRTTDVGPVEATASSSFADVDFPEARYVSVSPGPVQMAYVDVGPVDGPTVLVLHGNPAWSYYFAETITILTERGYRVVAPDLIGFGRSDKPLDRNAHTYDNHISWVRDLVVQLDLRDVVLHAHDWGGLIGMRVVPLVPERFAAIGIVNTGLPTGGPLPAGFERWQQTAQDLDAFSTVIQRGTTRPLTDAELDAFDAPWPTDELTAGPRQLPLEVPFGDGPQAAANLDALTFWDAWSKPFAIMFAAGRSAGAPGIDPVAVAEQIPGTIADQPQIVEGVGHYLHLDVADLVVAQIEALTS